MRIFVTLIVTAICINLSAQNGYVPVQVNLKDGKSYDVKHFGQLKCRNTSFTENHIFLKGMYMNNVTEIKSYKDIEKIVLEGFSADPVTTGGNEKAVIRIYKKNGVAVSLDEAEIIMSCYGVGDKYNQLVLQIDNPLTGQANEMAFDTKDIQSIIFK